MNDQFRKLWADKNFVIIDTETTGFHRPCEIIDFGMVTSSGIVQCDMLLKPLKEITPFITDLTGITNEMVADAASWPLLRGMLIEEMKGKTVITYNAKFDRHMMHCTDEMWGIPQQDYHDGIEWACAMEAYAALRGEWNEYYGNYKWIKLGDAMAQQGLDFPNAHRAKDDALATYRLMEHLCKS